MHLLLIIISFFLSQSVFSDTSLERQCVEQLCGKFQDSPIYFMPEEKLESFLDIVQVQRWRELKQSVLNIVEARKKHITTYAKAVQAATFDFENWSDQDILDRLPKIFETRYATYTDSAFPIGKRLMLLAKTRDNESQSFKTLLNKLIAFRSKEYNTILFFSHSLFKSFKSETELRAHLEKSLKDFKVKTNTRNNLDLIEKALKSSTEEAVALHDKLAYELLPDLNTSDIRKFCDKDCIETIRKYLMNINFSSEFNNLKNYYLRSDIEKIELANCSQDFLEKASSSLSLRRNFYKQIPYVEDEILDYLKEAGFSHSALNKIWSHMQSVVYKIKSEQYGEADQTSLIKDLVEYEFKKIKYNEFNNLNEQGLLDKIIHDIESNGSIYNYRTICSAPRKIDKGDYVNSKNLSGDGTYQLYISNLTALFSKESKQVFLHEFGHVLSNIFNEKDIPLTELNKYRSFRKCVSHDYTAPKKIGEGNYKHHLGDLFLTEEDSADVFSYLMTKNQNHLVECSLLDPNRLYTDYAEDAFIFQGAPNDTHSATFVRILREAHYKKRPLGTACQQVLKKYQSQLRFNTCSL